jgi:hypothetical protein
MRFDCAKVLLAECPAVISAPKAYEKLSSNVIITAAKNNAFEGGSI